jgi:hypothetical protein
MNDTLVKQDLSLNRCEFAIAAPWLLAGRAPEGESDEAGCGAHVALKPSG